MIWLLLILAAASYVGGGIAMKHADGLRHFTPSLLVFLGFSVGAALQTVAMRFEALSVAYVLVLGLEAVLAVTAGVLLFDEGLPARNILGVALVLAGMVLLKSSP